MSQTAETTPVITPSPPAAPAAPAAPVAEAKPAIPVPPPAPPITPASELLAGKYKSVDDLVKGYKELESRLGAPKPAETPAPPPLPQTVEEVLNLAGLKDSEVATQYLAKGELTAEQYAAFAKVGRGRGEVDAFLAGQKAMREAQELQQQQILNESAKYVGGDQQLQTLLQFAGTLPKARIDDLNARLADKNKYKGALAEILTEYKQTTGTANAAPVISGSPSVASAAPFVSKVEYQKARQESAARYGNPQNDPAYIARLLATSRANPEVLK